MKIFVPHVWWYESGLVIPCGKISAVRSPQHRPSGGEK